MSTDSDEDLPTSFDALARTCEECGTTLDRDQSHRLVDGRCPGCRYGGGVGGE